MSSLVINDRKSYAQQREWVKTFGLDNLKKKLQDEGYVSAEGQMIPNKNPFVKFILEGLPYPDPLEEAGLLPLYKHYMLLRNRPELDAAWKDGLDGRASMSLHHMFLIPCCLEWSIFNVLTLGLDPEFDLKAAIDMLTDMEILARKYANKCGWGDNLGLFFHCYPLNSIQTLHLHIVDLDNVGPSYKAQLHKNLPLSDVRDQLVKELMKTPKVNITINIFRQKSDK